MADDVPEDVRRAVLDRDDYTCQVCSRRAEDVGLHVHHVQFRSLGGGHDVHNLVALCGWCHQEVHYGRLRVGRYEVAPGMWETFWERLPYER